jgi:N-hydroxyarylamine O-acetyltransferase
MSRLDTEGYLDRLGIADPGEPSVAGLRALHAAHVERVTYEAIEIQLGRPTTVDPYESAERIVARHPGGYCYHLNGAFSSLLSRGDPH